jgi:hypothetical protein
MLESEEDLSMELRLNHVGTRDRIITHHQSIDCRSLPFWHVAGLEAIPGQRISNTGPHSGSLHAESTVNDTLSPQYFHAERPGNWFRDPKHLAQALGRNKWPFLDDSGHGFREIPLWGSSRPWLVFEPDFPIGETIATFLHYPKTEGFIAIDPLQFGPDSLRG